MYSLSHDTQEAVLSGKRKNLTSPHSLHSTGGGPSESSYIFMTSTMIVFPSSCLCYFMGISMGDIDVKCAGRCSP